VDACKQVILILAVKLWFRKGSSVVNALYSFKDEIVYAPKKKTTED
jgi:hypothetical protein